MTGSLISTTTPKQWISPELCPPPFLGWAAAGFTGHTLGACPKSWASQSEEGPVGWGCAGPGQAKPIRQRGSIERVTIFFTDPTRRSCMMDRKGRLRFECLPSSWKPPLKWQMATSQAAPPPPHMKEEDYLDGRTATGVPACGSCTPSQR